MRLRLIAATAGALALALAACGQQETAETDAAAGAATEEMTAAEEAAPAAEDAATTAEEPMTMALACVADVPEGAACTKDINACGHASSCECGEGYTYNAAMGRCLLAVADGASSAAIVQVEDDACVASASSSAICTMDINACGQPSSCSCEEGFVWDSIAGKCLKDLTAPTE